MNDDGSISTPFFEKLKPLIPLLEVLSLTQIEEDVIAAADASNVSFMQMEQMHETFERLNGNRIAVMQYVVNLTLAAEGLKVIGSPPMRKSSRYGIR